jgi:hypothetical protein
MEPRHKKLALVAAVGLGAVLVSVWFWFHDGELNDERPLPPLVRVADDAKPFLVSSEALPAHEGEYFAKPVIVADQDYQVVVAQHLAGDVSRLVQWRSKTDGTWSEAATLDNGSSQSKFFGDPWMQTDLRGRFYLVYIDLDEGRLAFRRSTDQCQTWSTPTVISRYADRPVLGISPSGKHVVIAASLAERSKNYPTKPLDGNDPQLAAKVAAAWDYSGGIFYSQNYGRSWQRLPGPLLNTHAIPFSVIVDDDGRIASSWIAAIGNAVVGVPATSRSVVCSTDDRGKTWVVSDLVADLQPDRNHPFNGERFPVLALGSQGMAYVVYVGPLAKQLFVRRMEGWTLIPDPVDLSDETADEVRMPAIAARGTMVHVTWMERHNRLWRIICRGSNDSGRTWSDRIRLDVPGVTSKAAAAPGADTGFQITSDDDQTCVTDDGSGEIQIVWAANGIGSKTGSRVCVAVVKWKRPE